MKSWIYGFFSEIQNKYKECSELIMFNSFTILLEILEEIIQQPQEK